MKLLTSDQSSNNNDDSSTSDSSHESRDSCEEYISFESVRNPSTQLEEAVRFSWPGIHQDSTNNSSSSSNDDQTPRTITLTTLLEENDLAPLFDGSRWAGTRLWAAAVRAAQYLSEQRELLPRPGKDVSLLELGCGLGMPGMVFHMLGGDVCLTDQTDILSQLQKNVRNNFPDTFVDVDLDCVAGDGKGEGEGSGGGSIRAMGLSWSREGVVELLRKTGRTCTGFDIVLNCDCVYEPLYGKSWQMLVETIDELLRCNPRCKVITSVERRQADGVDDFLQTMAQCAHVGSVQKAMEDQKNRIELYVTTGIFD